MTQLDLDFVRSQFPAFQEPSLQGWAFFENAGGSYPAAATVRRLHEFYMKTKVQPYAPYPASRRAGEKMDESYERIATLLNVEPDEVHFGPSTSMNTYVLSHALRPLMAEGDEVVVTNQDHEANSGAWRRLAETGIVVREWRVDPDTAELRVSDLEALLGRRTRAVAFTHCSNIVGTIHPVRRLTELIHEAGAMAIVDGVSFCPHGLPDIAELGADVYLFSLYKVYGPHLGAMYLRRDLNARLPNQGHFFNAGKAGARFTPAGPDHAQIASVNGVMDYLEAVADRHGLGSASVQARAAAVRTLFRDHESSLLQPLLDYLASRAEVRLIGKRQAAERAPTVAFTAAGQRPTDLALRLADVRLGVGAGHFYAYRLVEALGLGTGDGVVRASFVHYTSRSEVDRLIEALDASLRQPAG